MDKEIKIKLPIEINEDCQFLKDLDKSMMIQNSKSSMGHWNLMTSIIALEGYAKHGMKPNRHWKITDVKEYFGMNGSAEVLLGKLKYMKEDIIGK